MEFLSVNKSNLRKSFKNNDFSQNIKFVQLARLEVEKELNKMRIFEIL
jgi:hypothetical protein